MTERKKRICRRRQKRSVEKKSTKIQSLMPSILCRIRKKKYGSGGRGTRSDRTGRKNKAKDAK
jgi:hypothetical protein